MILGGQKYTRRQPVELAGVTAHHEHGHRPRMATQHTICVYCSSSDALSPTFFAAAEALGAAIARQGHALVYGGGATGLMGAVARAAHAHGGRVIGVIPERLAALSYADVDELIVTRDLRERKAIMEERATAFVGLPGGFGTLEELLEIVTLKQLGFHGKAIVLMNTGRFYAPLLELFETMYRERFAKPAFRQLYHVAQDSGSVLQYIEAYQPEELPTKWF